MRVLIALPNYVKFLKSAEYLVSSFDPDQMSGLVWIQTA